MKSLTFLSTTLLMLAMLGCQHSTALPVDDAAAQQPIKVPCKSYTTPPIQNKDKIKHMLFKEGKLNNNMSEEEIEHYINSYINKKSKPPIPCKNKMKAYLDTPIEVYYA